MHVGYLNTAQISATTQTTKQTHVHKIDSDEGTMVLFQTFC